MGNLSRRLGLEQPPQDPKLKGVPDAAIGRTVKRGSVPGIALAQFEALEARVAALEAIARKPAFESTKSQKGKTKA